MLVLTDLPLCPLKKYPRCPVTKKCSKALCACVPSHVQLSGAPWTVARQALLSVGFSRQEYCSGLPFSPPGRALSDPGIQPTSPVSPVWAGGFLTMRATWEAWTQNPSVRVMGLERKTPPCREQHQPLCSLQLERTLPSPCPYHLTRAPQEHRTSQDTGFYSSLNAAQHQSMEKGRQTARHLLC